MLTLELLSLLFFFFKKVVIDEIRVDSEEPGVTDAEVSFLKAGVVSLFFSFLSSWAAMVA